MALAGVAINEQVSTAVSPDVAEHDCRYLRLSLTLNAVDAPVGMSDTASFDLTDPLSRAKCP
jgi:hypothetical protein